MTIKKTTPGNSSLQNALRLLKLFSAEQPEWGVSQIATQLGLAKSTIHRLLSTLAAQGFVLKDPKTNSYRLSARLLRLGQAVISQYPLHHLAKPILQKLVQLTGETAHLCILKGTNVVYINKVECDHPIRLKSYIGRILPAYCSSAGQAILAYHPHIVEQVLSEELIAYTRHTPTTPLQIKAKLEQVRKKGIAVSVEELQEGVTSIAAPVWDKTKGQVIAAINIAGPTQRITTDKIPLLAKHIQQAASALSELQSRGTAHQD